MVYAPYLFVYLLVCSRTHVCVLMILYDTCQAQINCISCMGFDRHVSQPCSEKRLRETFPTHCLRRRRTIPCFPRNIQSINLFKCCYVSHGLDVFQINDRTKSVLGTLLHSERKENEDSPAPTFASFWF